MPRSGLACLALSFLACTRPNPDYVEPGPDASPDSSDPCSMVVNATGECVECVVDTDCASGVCDLDGESCVAAAAIIYVDPDGSDGDACGTADSPCASIQRGIDRSSSDAPVVHIAPAVYSEKLVIEAKTVTLVGGPGVEVSAAAFPDTQGLLITTGSEVDIRGMLFRDSRQEDHVEGDNGGVAILADDDVVLRMTDSVIEDSWFGIGIGAGAGLTLSHVALRDLEFGGVQARGTSRVTILRSTIADCGLGTGVRIGQSDNNGGELIIDRSVVTGCRTGIVANGVGFRITNSFIVRNGGIAPSTHVNAVELYSPIAVPFQQFEGNTIADNSNSNQLTTRGVVCELTSPFAAVGNVLYGGQGGALISGNCSWEYSNVEGGIAGEGNIDEPPMFVNPGAGDYRLMSGSACVDAGDPGSDLAEDFDGDERPLGAGFDIGADEVR